MACCLLTISQLSGQDVTSCNEEIFSNVCHLFRAQLKETEHASDHLWCMVYDDFLEKERFVINLPSKD